MLKLCEQTRYEIANKNGADELDTKSRCCLEVGELHKANLKRNREAIARLKNL